MVNEKLAESYLKRIWLPKWHEVEDIINKHIDKIKIK